jgi:hypothetical protein
MMMAQGGMRPRQRTRIGAKLADAIDTVVAGLGRLVRWRRATPAKAG